MATSDETVTIDKIYFETLLRRAQFHTTGIDFTTPVHLPTVTIPKLDHDSLLQAAREYGNLRQNLFKGGITDETLAILIHDDKHTEPLESMTNLNTNDDTSDGGAFYSQQAQLLSADISFSQTDHDYMYGRNPSYHFGVVGNGKGKEAFHNLNYEYGYGEYSPFDRNGASFLGSGNGNRYGRKTLANPGDQYQKHAKRSVQLRCLPDGVTHADIVDAVRGGMLLDIYLRTHDRTVQVSFLEEADAREFFRHCKRNDMYIRGKRVKVDWAERQFILPNHVANKIAMGATRNLVIHGTSPKHTKEQIKDHLEHIHNLTVVKIEFRGQNAHVSINSVHNAMFARTCMMSRTTYKLCKIDWDADECADPYASKLTATPSKERNALGKTKVPLNRFELLKMDDTEDGLTDGEDEDTSSTTFQTGISSGTAGHTV